MLDLVEKTAVNQHVAPQRATATESVSQDGATVKRAFSDLAVLRAVQRLLAWPLHKKKEYARPSCASVQVMETAMS